MSDDRRLSFAKVTFALGLSKPIDQENALFKVYKTFSRSIVARYITITTDM